MIKLTIAKSFSKKGVNKPQMNFIRGWYVMVPAHPSSVSAGPKSSWTQVTPSWTSFYADKVPDRVRPSPQGIGKHILHRATIPWSVAHRQVAHNTVEGERHGDVGAQVSHHAYLGGERHPPGQQITPEHRGDGALTRISLFFQR